MPAHSIIVYDGLSLSNDVIITELTITNTKTNTQTHTHHLCCQCQIIHCIKITCPYNINTPFLWLGEVHVPSLVLFFCLRTQQEAQQHTAMTNPTTRTNADTAIMMNTYRGGDVGGATEVGVADVVAVGMYFAVDKRANIKRWLKLLRHFQLRGGSD